MKKNILFLNLSLFIAVASQAQPVKPDLPLYNVILTPEQRVEWLLNELSPEEKMAQMIHNAPAIPRLGIPAYNWWNECLHGVGRAGYATVFPMPIGMAASFDTSLLHQVAIAIADEARAKYNQAQRDSNFSTYHGLTFWSPNINLFRDPRWGRGMETYGEDPFLTGILGTAFIHGLQGSDPKYLKLVATMKHFAVHSGPEATRHSFNASVSDFDLYNSYLPHFKRCIDDAGVESVMCAYNRLRDEPCCGNDALLNDILRKQWHFKGYVVSDCWAISDFYQFHKITKDAVSSSAMAIHAGTDLNCGSSYNSLPQALEQGLISQKDIDTAIQRLFLARLKLGMFDPQESVPFSSIKMTRVDTMVHRDLALQMARESIVLLKNEGNLLPLSKKIRSIAIIGPNADANESLLGNYHGSPGLLITPLQAIRNTLEGKVQINYVAGIPFVNGLSAYCLPPEAPEMNLSLIGQSWMEQALEAGRSSDAIIMFMGLSPSLEGEALQVEIPGFAGGDRTSLYLPEIQQNLIKMMHTLNKPIVLVLMSGSALAIPWEKEHIPAVLQAWYPGQAGGQAIADVLFGDFNPCGKLPVTIYSGDTDLPAFSDYSMKNRTYRFFKGKPLFEFGFGLSYTRFTLTDIQLEDPSIPMDGQTYISATLTNSGKRAGVEVVQLYIDFPEDPFEDAQNQANPELKAFQRVQLEPGQSQRLKFLINQKSISRLNSNGEYQLKGMYKLMLAQSSAAKSNPLILKLKKH